mmetsp:Transcript_75054/g.188933  ORF Transcript_75054/g.188933 Transcript_75054/m.188933 type:complete len:277 (+) Transcript_75054:701-1531(+)
MPAASGLHRPLWAMRLLHGRSSRAAATATWMAACNTAGWQAASAVVQTRRSRWERVGEPVGHVQVAECISAALRETGSHSKPVELRNEKALLLTNLHAEKLRRTADLRHAGKRLTSSLMRVQRDALKRLGLLRIDNGAVEDCEGLPELLAVQVRHNLKHGLDPFSSHQLLLLLHQLAMQVMLHHLLRLLQLEELPLPYGSGGVLRTAWLLGRWHALSKGSNCSTSTACRLRRRRRSQLTSFGKARLQVESRLRLWFRHETLRHSSCQALVEPRRRG